MKSFVITLTDIQESTDAATNVIASSAKVENDFQIEVFDAVIEGQVKDLMQLYNLRWNWPWESHTNDMQSGIFKQPYLTAKRDRRIACFLSHYKLWTYAVEHDESVLVLEHDAKFIRKLDTDLLEKSKYGVIGINDPRKATRKSDIYHNAVQEQDGLVVDCPKIDMDNIAQGLAGNSAYYIKPTAAKKLLKLVDEYGAWPNDAIMCRQLMPRQLGQLKKYATTVQGMISYTTL
jgi:GR25 family glycosyltransferase involved in LPS biosynthesis